MTGSRADIIVADDIEIALNSLTQTERDKLSETVKEFDSILKPLETSKIIYLGTPHVEDSLYTKLRERGYQATIWPARKPLEKDLRKYEGATTKLVDKIFKDPRIPPGEILDPQRFPENVLRERELSLGKAMFALQFMLDTQLSDVQKFPLKISDLIIQECDQHRMPLTYQFGPSSVTLKNDLPNVAMTGDNFYGPHSMALQSASYEDTVMFIDPSGRGKDETAYAVVSSLNGYLFLRDAGGFADGYDESLVLTPLVALAKAMGVNEIVTESNFGDGMFNNLLRPILNKGHGDCRLSEVRSSKQKERRIIDTLEPIMATHKLIVCPSVIKKDWNSVQEYEQEIRAHKMLVYQMTRISYEKGCLRYDDRLDALAGACAYFVDRINRDHEEGRQAQIAEALDKELEKWLESIGKGTNSTPSWIQL